MVVNAKFFQTKNFQDYTNAAAVSNSYFKDIQRQLNKK